MKNKLTNALGFIVYVFLTVTGITFIANKIQDIRESKEPDPPIRHIRKKTVYPNDWYPDCTPEDFNKWSENIHRQLN